MFAGFVALSVARNAVSVAAVIMNNTLLVQIKSWSDVPPVCVRTTAFEQHDLEVRYLAWSWCQFQVLQY